MDEIIKNNYVPLAFCFYFIFKENSKKQTNEGTLLVSKRGK